MIVPRIHEREEAYILQNGTTASSSSSPPAGLFLIGTTDVEHKGSPREAKISDAGSTTCARWSMPTSPGR